MNFLAHILLSGSEPDIQVGGLLGDFIKGPLKGQCPSKVEQGIRLHRHLDAYMDELPVMGELLTLFPKPWRRYGGIVIDVGFDHLLARDWQRFHHQELKPFCQAFYTHLETHRDWLPENARHFCDRAPAIGWLENYADAEIIPAVLNRVGERFRTPIPLADAWPIVAQHQADFEYGFGEIMMALTQRAEESLNGRI